MSNRRNFVKGLSLLGLMPSWLSELSSLTELIHANDGVDWDQVRLQFPISSWEKIHLNSGSAGVMPTPVQEHLIKLIRQLNSKAPYEVWGEWQEVKKANISRLATTLKSKPEELQIVRNTTEALNMIIYGLRLEPNDQVIVASYDYPYARNTWANRSERDGIEVRIVDIHLPATDEEIVEAYRAALTDKTKVIHVTHMTHREGHIMPVKAITELAHENGVEVVVDGAHVVGHIDCDLADIGCDYFASSLHKWLNAPIGTGLIFVKEEKIDSLYGHPSSYENSRDSISKYEHLGTRAWHNEIGISAALDFHKLLGFENKKERLQFLKEYWIEKVEDIPSVSMHTWKDARYSGAVATLSVKDISGGNLVRKLDKDYNIHAKSVGAGWGSGLRVSPNIFTSTDELDTFAKAIREIARI